MRTAVLATSLTLALSSLATVAAAAPGQTTATTATTVVRKTQPSLPPGTSLRPRCADHSCKSWVLVDDATGTIHADSATPNGLTAMDIQKAYNVDVTAGSGVTVAVVDAYGYAAIESDLAMYRSTFGLPPCTIASGCLTVVNDNGQTAPLPADNPDWIGETALDVDMVSAACPMCKIVVVQAGAPGNAGLDIGQLAATKLGVDAISDSWGGPEDNNSLNEDPTFHNAGIGTFAASGDNGYDSFQMGQNGPSYPSTSEFVIAVGGTNLATSQTPRGYTETAWSNAGSSCSTVIAKPSYQPAQAACTMRAASDISAAASGQVGIATYIADQGGWMPVFGTSAASPIATAIFAGAGHADATPAFLYKHPDAFLDIAIGQNGSCGTNLCIAGTGWDGPTGLGTPDQAKLKAIGNVAGAGPAVTITFPSDGDTVMPGFTVAATPADGAAYITIDIDGVKVAALNTAPYQFSAPTSLADGTHMIQVTAFDIDHNSNSSMINVTQSATGSDGGGGGGGGGGCAAGGGGAGAGVILALGAIVTRRRRAA